MDVDSGARDQPDFSGVMADPAFLQGVLESLPGVDPNNQDVQKAVGSLSAKDKKEKDDKNDKK